MPRNYVRKTFRGSWTIHQLRNAVSKVRDGASIRATAELFGIPYSTLRERLTEATTTAPRFGTKPVFSLETEKEIASHCIKMAKMFYGLTKLELRKAVFDYAEKNGIPHRFNKDIKLAGKDWLEGFLKRNIGISIRKPEATSVNRIKAFNKVEVNKFYKNLEEVNAEYNFQPDRIYNFDETGRNIVHKPKLIIAKKGMKRVGAATSGERGKNHTAACAVSAAGHYIPPMIIFPRVRMSANLMIDGPPGAIYKASKSGYITEDLFVEWLVHFKEKTNSSIENPVLLILDNHSTHCSVEAFDYCIANGIVVLSIPPHTSHRLQPLDLTVFGPLSTAFNNACDAKMKENGYMAMTSELIPSLLKVAWNKICSTEKAVNGFKAAGICPFNPNIFSDDEFYTEPESVPNEVEMNKDIEPESTVNEDQMETSVEIEHLENVEATEEELMMSGFVAVEPLVPVSAEKSVKVSFSEIVPLPTASNVKKSNRKPREKQHSEIMTSAQYKIVLDEKRQRRDLKEQKILLNKQAVGTAKKRGRPKKNEVEKTAKKETVTKKAVPKKTVTKKTDGSIEVEKTAKKENVSKKPVPKKTVTKKTDGSVSGGRKKIHGGKCGPAEAAKKKGTLNHVNFEQFFIENLSLVATGDSDDSE